MSEHEHVFLSPSPAGHEAGDPDRCACGEWKPDEERCQRCGHANPVWYAPNEVWNATVRKDGADEWGFLCPPCFAELAESRVLGERVRWAFVPEVLA